MFPRPYRGRKKSHRLIGEGFTERNDNGLETVRVECGGEVKVLCHLNRRAWNVSNGHREHFRVLADNFSVEEWQVGVNDTMRRVEPDLTSVFEQVDVFEGNRDVLTPKSDWKRRLSKWNCFFRRSEDFKWHDRQGIVTNKTSWAANQHGLHSNVIGSVSVAWMDQLKSFTWEWIHLHLQTLNFFVVQRFSIHMLLLRLQQLDELLFNRWLHNNAANLI